MLANNFDDGTTSASPTTDRPQHDEADTGVDESDSEPVTSDDRVVERDGSFRANGDRTDPSGDRSTARGFFVLGGISFVGGLVVSDGAQVLYALAGIGVFAGLLIYTTSRGRFIDAVDGKRVYSACAINQMVLGEELGLTADRIYLPESKTESGLVRLFVPATDDADLSNDFTATDAFGSERRGLLLEPTGKDFLREVEDTLTGTTSTSPEVLADQLTTALVNRFELVTDADPIVDASEETVTVAVSGSAFGSVDQFDHPVASFIASGLAAGLDRRIALEVSSETDRGEDLVICYWGERNE